MEFGAASRLQNFISFKRHKISARANPAHKAPVRTGALTPTKSRSRRNLFARRPPARDPPAPKSQSMRAAYEILKFHRPQSRAILSCDRPKPVSCSKFHSYRKVNSSRKILTLPRAARRRFACYTLHAVCHAVPACSAHHMPHVTPHAERRKTQTVQSKIRKSLRQNPASGANFYFTAR